MSKKKKLSEHTRNIRFFSTTSKCLIWVITINAIAWIWCSYGLAWTGHVEIAESLSSNVCTVCIGSVCMYMLKTVVENVFRYNNFGGQAQSFQPQESPIIEEDEDNVSKSFN